MRRRHMLVLLAALPWGTASALAETAPRHPPKGMLTGRTLPRFASLRADAVNLRRGPGERYPIDWVYHRRGLPVEIVHEFYDWRQVRTPDGAKGWVHQGLLSGHRGFIVSTTRAVLRRAPHGDARPVAYLDHGVVGDLHHCATGAAWCRVQVGSHAGWLRRAAFWGAYKDEAVND